MTNWPPIHVTDHALARFVERTRRSASEAYEAAARAHAIGIKPDRIQGELGKCLRRKAATHPGEVRYMDRLVWIFRDGALISVWRPPMSAEAPDPKVGVKSTERSTAA